MLMGALQYVDTPGYSAILLRRTFAALDKPNAIMRRAIAWLAHQAGVTWAAGRKTLIFRCPGGGTSEITFGYLKYDRDLEQYASAEYQYVGFDELTQFTEKQYLGMFERIRRLRGSDIPLRVRSASNPGGVGHDWTKKRFVDPEARRAGRAFIPARIVDNPHIDRDEYIKALENVPIGRRKQILEGLWVNYTQGAWFDPALADIVEWCPSESMRWVRYWDLASTEKTDDNDPDFTAGMKIGHHTKSGLWYVADGQIFQKNPGDVKLRVKHTAQRDGTEVPVLIEQEPGSGGKFVIADFTINLAGHVVIADRVTGDKQVRAAPWQTQWQAGNVKVVKGPWNDVFFEQHEAFPTEGVHDDVVDGCSGGFAYLAGKPAPSVTVG